MTIYVKAGRGSMVIIDIYNAIVFNELHFVENYGAMEK